MKRVARTFAHWWMCLNQHPVTIILFTPMCLAFILIGWMLGQTQMFLLILTTALSVDASLEARMVMLKQDEDNGS